MSSDNDLDDLPQGPALPADVQVYVEPLDDSPSGEDLEYDDQFMELGQLVLGKPETQFAPAEPPPWPQVQALAEELLVRTRDLRVALWWTRARVNLEGLPGLASGLGLMYGLIERLWDSVHPGLDPDDGDAFSRINVLGSLGALDGLLGDLRQSRVMDERRLGGLRTRDIEIGLDRIPARADETPPSLSEIQGMLAEHTDLAEQLGAACTTCMDMLNAMQDFVNDKVGIGNGPSLDDMLDMVRAVQSALPAPDLPADMGDNDDDGGDIGIDDTSDDADDGDDTPRRSGRGKRGPGSIDSRQDAVKAIQLICAYLERSEPTNPAQLLLRRAERLIEKNFLELMRELAPNALNEVALIMGVDPSTIGEQN